MSQYTHHHKTMANVLQERHSFTQIFNTNSRYGHYDANEITCKVITHVDTPTTQKGPIATKHCYDKFLQREYRNGAKIK